MANQDGCHSEMITHVLRHMTSSPHNADVKSDISDVLSTLALKSWNSCTKYVVEMAARKKKIVFKFDTS